MSKIFGFDEEDITTALRKVSGLFDLLGLPQQPRPKAEAPSEASAASREVSEPPVVVATTQRPAEPNGRWWEYLLQTDRSPSLLHFFHGAMLEEISDMPPGVSATVSLSEPPDSLTVAFEAEAHGPSVRCVYELTVRKVEDNREERRPRRSRAKTKRS